MSDVTIQAVQPVLGLPEGATVTVERTTRVQRAIAAGRVRVVDAKAPLVADYPAESGEGE